jgi:TolB-like protein
MDRIYAFGPFRLDASAEILFRGVKPLPLGRRATALLRTLVGRAGVPVSKDALLEAAWPGLAVEESNLTVQIASLRRILGEEPGGEDWIETLPRRGYRFVGPEVSTPELSVDATKSPGSKPAGVEPNALPVKPSIAVLPFQNMSGDLGQDYFCHGVVEDIITGLSRVKWLFVVAHNSSFIYKGRAVDVKQVGRELGVRYILEGSVRKAADRVRVSGQLIDAETGAHVWAEHYDRKYDDTFALQDDITLSVVGTIEPTLRSAEIDRAKRKRPENLSAYDLVLQAHADTYTRMPAQSKRALVLLQRALALEPTYALAHAYAALCHHSIFLRDGMREEHRVASMRHAEAAITYGQDDATALSFAGFTIGMEGRDRATALSLFEHALSVSPSSAHTYICGSAVLAFGGQAERAIEWAACGLRLSPFDPWRASALVALALGHFHRGRFEDAVAAGRKAVHASPGFSIAYLTLAAPLATLGALDEAKAVAAKTLELQPGFRYGRHFASLAVAPDLAAALGDALELAGLPE